MPTERATKRPVNFVRITACIGQETGASYAIRGHVKGRRTAVKSRRTAVKSRRQPHRPRAGAPRQMP